MHLQVQLVSGADVIGCNWSKVQLDFTINFDEDSEDEYVPVDDELLLLEDESCLKKRKRKDTKTATSKKVKTDFDCNMCGKSFSRKDSLTRHRKNYCT